MRYLATIAALGSIASTALAGGTSGLDVKLEMQSNSKVKATISNTGRHSIKVLETGSILDQHPVQKLSVSNSSREVEFQGIRVYPDFNAGESVFRNIAGGDFVEVTFDVAETYDLSTGGVFDLQSNGIFHFAKDGDIKNLDTVSFFSNKIEAEVKGDEAAEIYTAFHENVKRATIQTSCQGQRRDAVGTAIYNTHRIAVMAAKAARNGPAGKMIEYFEKADQKTRNIVASGFEKMAQLYASEDGQTPRLYCNDIANFCSGNTAYALPGQGNIVYCNPWFNYPRLTPGCRQVDQAHIAVHEATHLPIMKGTSDYTTYGYQNSIKLPANKNLNHADTWAYFAHDTLSGC